MTLLGSHQNPEWAGSHADTDNATNSNYYIDNYKFAIKVAEVMVNKILSESESKTPDHYPPVRSWCPKSGGEGRKKRNPEKLS